MSFDFRDPERSDIAALTAEFRYRICWEGTRELLKSKDVDPMQCLLLSCDQGDDVNGLLMLPDGQLVDFDVRENPTNRGHESFTNWSLVQYTGRDIEIARSIVGSEDSGEFDAWVTDYFNQEWRARDEPLPPKRSVDSN